MSYQYDQYIENHRSKVLEAFSWIKTNLPELVDEEKFSDDQPLTIRTASFEGLIKNHDMSKYSLEEYNAYDAYFYGNNRSYQVVEEFNKAWLHHIHHNKHHWQYWVLVSDEPNGDDKCIEMPYEYVIEMICDWWSFSWNDGNLYTIFDWYTEHEGNMELHKDTEYLVNYILNRIKRKLTELEYVPANNNEKKPKIIAVDFDGTLCTNKYPEIGEPKSEIIKYIKQQKEQGAKIILWTCRSGDLLENALDWCRKHDVALDCVNENLPEIIEDFGSDTRKIFANEYIDDRNFFPSEDKEVIEDECC